MRNKFYALILLAFCFSTVRAQIYFYSNDTTGAYASVATNATGVKMTRYNGANRPPSQCIEGFSSESFTTVTTYSSSLPAMEADVSANSSYQLNVTGFRVGIRRSNTGPADAMLAYSTDGGTTWINQGTIVSPNNGNCGDTIPAQWTVSLTVPATNTLKFRVYGFNASGTTGTLQLLNLEIDGTVTTSDSISTTASSFGPFCMGLNDTISVPFTQVGTFTGLFQVQMSDASGIFPNNATSNIISTGSATSPVTAIIPSTTAWANGYRVRVVNASPTFYNSGSNGSNIVINQSVTPAFVPAGINRALTLCGTAPYTFIAPTDTFGGNAPTFEWSINGTITATGYSYTASFANNDTVRCTLVSNAVCAVPNTITSPYVAITVVPAAYSTVYDTICPGASLTLGTRSFNATGTYLDTTSASQGCDSITTLHLYVRPYIRTTITDTLCPGLSYTFGGHTYTTSGTYADTTGCDSIATLSLYIKTLKRTNISASICPGSAYLFNGTSYTAAGTYSDTVRCDSIVTLTLSLKTYQTYNISATFCHGSSYTYHGTTFTNPGTYRDTLSCDSIVVLTLNYSALTTYSLSASFCPGGNYIFHGTTYTSPGTIRDTLGCDSIVVLTLTYKTYQTYPTSATFCHGGSYTYRGTSYTSPGTYRDTVSCDSILVLTLTYSTLQTYHTGASICPNTSYDFYGTNYSTAGTYTDTIGCDSIVILSLSVKTQQTYPVSATFCHGSTYTFYGTTYSSPGTYSDTVSCDSIVVLTLTYGTLQTHFSAASICKGGSYTFFGTTYTTPGTYTDTLGCDSIMILALVIDTPTAVTWTPSVTSLIWCGSTSDLVLTGASPAGGVYSGRYVSGDTLYNYHANTTVVVTYTYTDGFHCSSTDSASFSLSICNGISETILTDAISVYPNPTDNIIHLDVSGTSGPSTITITDMLGQTIPTTTTTGTVIHQDIDLSSFTKGLYLLTVRDADGASGTRVIAKD